MNKKIIVAFIIIVLLVIALIFAKPYLFTSTPKSSVLEVYIQTQSFDSYGIYVMEDRNIEVIKGISKDITNEAGVAWGKVTDRQKVKLSDEQYQSLIILANELDASSYEVVPGLRTFAEPLIGVWYNGKAYSTYHSEITLREIVSKAIEYSPMPIEPLPPQPIIRS